MPREESPQPAAYPAQKARGRDVVLRTQLGHLILVIGLAGALALALLLLVLR